ncbi:uncharacterized protein BX664DRAFT_16687 [Halteromyces radiatus]|uniref:uncharacterized protein n=1 Tax=Halteromyces radiatus TaxID=101107 RepID=UPI0022204C36|nr:uncharacterized protein BX664DRAFT_16687 [Halteromyces radiatus]KAI8099242.1 hypothetical protein BX664DRAFT_16687 [Halteromyces radiatus]
MWCKKRGIHLMKAPVNRKRKLDDDQGKHRYREVFTLKDEYLDNVIDTIARYGPRYRKQIDHLKKEGHAIAGCIIRSPGDENEEKRIELVNKMAILW